jgi:DNA-binding transcriptional MerR regulator
MKKYYSISEVSKIFDIHAHQLRYLEKAVPNFEVHRIRGRRYYTRDNIEMMMKFIPGVDGVNIERLQKHYDILRQVDILAGRLREVKKKIKLAFQLIEI